MRRVTSNAVAAFFAGVRGCWGNTQVALERDPTYPQQEWVMRLHGNAIARRPNHGQVKITNAGWDTRTTRDRLYGICDYLGVNRQVVVDLPDDTWTPIAREEVTT